MEKIKCKNCGHEWIPRIESPQECPNCKTRKWEENREVKEEKGKNGL